MIMQQKARQNLQCGHDVKRCHAPHQLLYRRQSGRSLRRWQRVAANTLASASSQSLHTRADRQDIPAQHLVKQVLDTAPGGHGYANLQRADQAWRALCNSPPTRLVQQVIAEEKGPRPQAAGVTVAESDVVVLGGTLGIFQATALQLAGCSVTVVERGRLVGREQEWNIGRKELQVFVDLGVVTAAEMEEAIVSEFNPVRIAIGDAEIVTEDILNCGVYPKRLLEFVKQRFLAAGGRLLEGADFQAASVHPDGAAVRLRVSAGALQRWEAGGAGGEGAQLTTSPASPGSKGEEELTLHARLILDAMGSFSPIAAQARGGAKPDSVVLMVGSCSQGVQPRCRSAAADLLYSFTPIDRRLKLQLFWEVFPARDGLTTYAFAYVDPAQGRLSLEELYAEYLRLLPEYQCCRPEDVKVLRAFHGFVPNWIDSPLRPCTARLLYIGDASGNRSALSFAGFGAIARHLERITRAVTEALQLDDLSQSSMALLQPRSPAISMTAAMQQSMGTRMGQDFQSVQATLINDYIGGSFREMRHMGPEVYKPFMQDVMQAGTLSRIIGRQIVTDPGILLRVTKFMNDPKAGLLLGRSYIAILWYDALWRLWSGIGRPVARRVLAGRPHAQWRFERQLEAWQYGSARDYRAD